MLSIKDLETADLDTVMTLEQFLDQVPFNDQGLIPAVAQDRESQSVLMLGWMDRTAIMTTLDSGYATYYSRSRQTYWRKGETSGHLQKLCDMHFDCDGDTLLLTVDQSGPACHTERANCFYLKVDAEQVIVSHPK